MTRREIKFRIWDQRSKSYFFFSDPIADPEYDFLSFLCDHTNPNPFSFEGTKGEIQPEQFTGLKDRGGKDIYEGDIVRDADWGQPVRAVGQVYWQGHEWVYGKSPKHKTWYPWSDVVAEGGRNVEVIGSIHENPELL